MLEKEKGTNKHVEFNFLSSLSELCMQVNDNSQVSTEHYK